MDRKDYLRYISHFISYVDPLVSKLEYRAYLKKHVGASLTAAPEKDVRDAARHLYTAYVASLYSRYDAWVLAKKLTTKQIAELIEEEVALGKRFGVYTETVDRDLSPKKMDAKMKAISEKTGYEKTLSEVMEDAPVVVRQRKAPAKRATGKAGKSPAKKAAKAKAAAKTTAARKTAGKSPKKGVRKCSDYSVKELRDMAAVKEIKGRSTMKKDELCAALKIPK